MILKHLSMQTDCRRFKAVIGEYGKVMPRMQGHILKSLDVAVEIVEYIQEKCTAEGLPRQPKLDEISRDIAIYRSRIKHLSSVFEAIAVEFKVAEAAMDKENGEKRMNAVFERFCKFHDKRREFDAAMAKADKRWRKIQDGILSQFAS